MIRLFPAVVAIAALALLAACTQAADETPTTPAATDTPTATQPPGGAGGGELEGTVVPVTPFPSPEPVPDDWPAYSDPRGRFALRYPPGWFLDRGGEEMPPGALDTTNVGLFSYDPDSWSKPYFPPGSVKVEVHTVALGIGVTSCDPDGATPATVGGAAGWEVLTIYSASAEQSGIPEESRLSRIHQVAADHKGYRFCVIGLFHQMQPDETTFAQIVSSFQFTN